MLKVEPSDRITFPLSSDSIVHVRYFDMEDVIGAPDYILESTQLYDTRARLFGTVDDEIATRGGILLWNQVVAEDPAGVPFVIVDGTEIGKLSLTVDAHEFMSLIPRGGKITVHAVGCYKSFDEDGGIGFSAIPLITPQGVDAIGGHVERGETLGHALKREWQEETGMEMEDTSIRGLYLHMDKGYVNFIMVIDSSRSVNKECRKPWVNEAITMINQTGIHLGLWSYSPCRVVTSRFASLEPVFDSPLGKVRVNGLAVARQRAFDTNFRIIGNKANVIVKSMNSIIGMCEPGFLICKNNLQNRNDPIGIGFDDQSVCHPLLKNR